MPAYDPATDIEPRWYHWAALSGCTVIMLGIGLIEVMNGADMTSRFFAVDTVVVRILGAGLVACAFWLPLRHDRAFTVSMWLLGLTIAENLVTYRFEAYPLASTGDVLLFLVVAFAVPIVILAQLRSVLSTRVPPPAA